MTDAEIEAVEFCLCMAIMIEEAETMPDWDIDMRVSCNGLCYVLDRARGFGLLSAHTYRLVLRALYRQRQKAARSSYLLAPLRRFWWPEGDWRPRVRALRRMAQDIIDNAQRGSPCQKR